MADKLIKMERVGEIEVHLLDKTMSAYFKSQYFEVASIPTRRPSHIQKHWHIRLEDADAAFVFAVENAKKEQGLPNLSDLLTYV